MAIPTVKWDGKGLQLDKYFMEHQIERPANEQVEEGWVTINGRHIFIGDDGIITKGPAEIVGKHVGNINASSNVLPKETGDLAKYYHQKNWFKAMVAPGMEGADIHGKGTYMAPTPEEAAGWGKNVKSVAVDWESIDKGVIKIMSGDADKGKLFYDPKKNAMVPSPGDKKVTATYGGKFGGFVVHDRTMVKIANEQLKEDEGRWITKDGHPIFIGGNNPEVKAFVKTLPHRSNRQHLSDIDPALPTTPSGQVYNLVQAVVGFTGNRDYKGISDASYAMNTKGVKASDLGADGKDAEIINNAIRESEPQSEPVYRGVGTRRGHPSLDNIKVGDVYTMGGVKSFSFDKRVAVNNLPGPPGGNSVLFETVGPVKGIPVAAISEYPKEQEFITQGKFKVIGIGTMPIHDTPGSKLAKVVKLQQVGVF